jgi:hypothetical protein
MSHISVWQKIAAMKDEEEEANGEEDSYDPLVLVRPRCACVEAEKHAPFVLIPSTSIYMDDSAGISCSQ